LDWIGIVVNIGGREFECAELHYPSIYGLRRGYETLFRDVFAGIDPDLDAQVEFGEFQKLEDPTSRS
ncbi:hypothetical protein Goshw_015269, partial [Gossypium schwendimanii]|nr:hypothetical protein [Gossypium schwendimanii]